MDKTLEQELLAFLNTATEKYDATCLRILYSEQLEMFSIQKTFTENYVKIIHATKPGGLSGISHQYTIEDLANQLTWIEAKLFQSISFRELLGQAWSKKDGETRSPHVLTMIRRST
jgi:hypothetical protein